jgi:hypothetical protein
MQIRLRAGDVLVFRGDFVQGGAVYGIMCCIHTYLYVEGIGRPKHGGVEETHFMRDEKYISKQ